MASAQSSQGICRGRGRQPQILGNAQPRYRSESRRLSDRWRPVKTAAHKRDHCPGALHEGDAIRVFSRSAAGWMDGDVVKFVEGNFVRVEYEVGGHWCGKTLHVHSENLIIPTTITSSSDEEPITSSSEEEHDPGIFQETQSQFVSLSAAIEASHEQGYPTLKAWCKSHLHFHGTKPQISGYRWTTCKKFLLHDDSQVKVPITLALDVGGADDDDGIAPLYHYTSTQFFKGIKVERRLEARLWERADADRRATDLCFGDGIYGTCREPAFFGTQKAILFNNYNLTRDRNVGLGLENRAQVCIPLRVGKKQRGVNLFNVNEDDFLMELDGEKVPHIPGVTRCGTPVNPPGEPYRDIWLLRPRRDDGRVDDADQHLLSVEEIIEVYKQRQRKKTRDDPRANAGLELAHSHMRAHLQRGDPAALRLIIELIKDRNFAAARFIEMMQDGKKDEEGNTAGKKMLEKKYPHTANEAMLLSMELLNQHRCKRY